MSCDYYDDYEEIWELTNAIKVTFYEWSKGDAIKRIISGSYTELTRDQAMNLIYAKRGL
jgi:hypothetical protein